MSWLIEKKKKGQMPARCQKIREAPATIPTNLCKKITCPLSSAKLEQNDSDFFHEAAYTTPVLQRRILGCSRLDSH